MGLVRTRMQLVVMFLAGHTLFGAGCNSQCPPDGKEVIIEMRPASGVDAGCAASCEGRELKSCEFVTNEDGGIDAACSFYYPQQCA
jgi:hypothetical protein